MRGKTALFILLIFSILSLQCTPKIYDTPEVNVTYSAITVSFTVSGAMSVGSKVLFTPVISGGAGGNYKLEWDWNNDGTIDYACMYPAVNKVEHEFWEAKTYSVRLKVTDKSGTASYQADVTIIVGMQPLTINSFYQVGSPLMSGVDITFEGIAKYGSGDYRFKWSFGDGSTYPPDGTFLDAGIYQAKHNFASGGTKNITLTARDSSGNEASKTIVFEIESHTKYLIIYQKNSEIWKMYQNGGDKQKITDGIHPHITCNGSQIVYVKKEKVEARIHVISKNGGTSNCISDDYPSQDSYRVRKFYLDSEPKWSADGSRVAFTRRTMTVEIPEELTAEKMMQLFDAGGYRYITGYDMYNQPIYGYTADGQYLRNEAFTYHPATEPPAPVVPAKYVLKTTLTDEQRQRIVRLLGWIKIPNLLDPMAAPIYALTRAITPQYDLWVMNANGSGKTQLVANAIQPAWKPDGSEIYFVKNNYIQYIPSSGGAETQLLPGGKYPAFTPDGSTISFTNVDPNDPEGNYKIFVFSGFFSQITSGGNDDAFISWNSQSQKLVFSRAYNVITNPETGEAVQGYLMYITSYPANQFIFRIDGDDIAENIYSNFVNNF